MINSDSLEVVVTETAHHEEVFYQSAEFWVGLSFVIVVSALFLPIYKIAKKAIYQRIERIRKDLHEAENLKLEAQKLYAEYERKFSNIENEVSEIIKGQNDMIAQTKEKKMKELETFEIHKQQELDVQIELAFEKIKYNVIEKITQSSINLVNKVLRTKLTKSDYNRFINDSIDNIKNM